MQRQVNDDTKHIFNDLACRRQAAEHRGDDDEVRRIDEDVQETCELVGQPSVQAFHDARLGTGPTALEK
ncbi:MAG: hypothetical protein OXK82_10665 [Deltaproteobacteria bacterium]|nr:hypothetical protein [Deltaproteobacteria bacterium]